jgi:hypothetical protein
MHEFSELEIILELLDLNVLIPKCEIVSVYKGKFYKNNTDVDIT